MEYKGQNINQTNMKPFRQRLLRALAAVAFVAVSAVPLHAQKTFSDMEQLTVNEKVTTVITASEAHTPCRHVDGHSGGRQAP